MFSLLTLPSSSKTGSSFIVTASVKYCVCDFGILKFDKNNIRNKIKLTFQEQNSKQQNNRMKKITISSARVHAFNDFCSIFFDRR